MVADFSEDPECHGENTDHSLTLAPIDPSGDLAEPDLQPHGLPTGKTRVSRDDSPPTAREGYTRSQRLDHFWGIAQLGKVQAFKE